MTREISIVIPVYNVKRHLRHCVDSVLHQTYGETEIILIDDCSTDGSNLICEEYAKQYRNIVFIQNSVNMGVEKARILGIKKSRGSFIMFVDSDDYLSPNAVELFVNEQKRTNADIVEGSSKRVFGDGGAGKPSVNQPLLIEQPKLFEEYYISFFGMNILGVNVWNKLYRRTLFTEEVLVPSGLKMGEDLFLNMQIFPNIKIWSQIADITYYYRLGGMTMGSNSTFYSDQKKLYYLKLSKIEQYKYLKGLKTTKIEMVNVLYTELNRMLLKQGKDSAMSFLLQESDSGLLDEITDGVDYEPTHFKLLKEKRFDEVLSLAQKSINKQRIRRWIINLVTPVLRYF